jgi:hypothetical protein
MTMCQMPASNSHHPTIECSHPADNAACLSRLLPADTATSQTLALASVASGSKSAAAEKGARLLTMVAHPAVPAAGTMSWQHPCPCLAW